MVKKVYTPEQIINKLREAEIHLSQGASIGNHSRQMPIKSSKSSSKYRKHPVIEFVYTNKYNGG